MEYGPSSIEPNIHVTFFSLAYSKISIAFVTPPHFISFMFIMSALFDSMTFLTSSSVKTASSAKMGISEASAIFFKPSKSAAMTGCSISSIFMSCIFFINMSESSKLHA